MAGSQNYLKGTITLDEPKTPLEISVPFEPKLYCVILRSMDSSVTSLQNTMAIGGVWTNTDGASIPSTFNNGFYQVAEATPSTSRVATLQLPVYSNGILSLDTRSNSFPWAKGTYDYIIVG